MSKPIMLEQMFSIYGKSSKKRLAEQSINEYEKPIVDPSVQKCSMVAHFDDIKMVPTTFNLETFFKITFNCEAIREDFSVVKYTAKRDAPDDVKDIPDDEVDSQIQKSMASVDDDGSDEIARQISKAVKAKNSEKGLRPTYVDYDAFHWDVYRKKITPYGVENKIRELTRAGVINLGDFKITIVDDAGPADSSRIWEVFRAKDKKNTQPTPIVLGYGYSFTFSSINRLKKYSEKDCFEVIKKFAPQFEKSILTNTEYYTFKK
jgi:hypothetical protein